MDRVTNNTYENNTDIPSNSMYCEVSELIGKINDSDAPYEERNVIVQEFLSSYIKEKLKNPEKFQNIFYTENGSIYFTFEDGCSIRFKNTETGWSVQPILKHTFYLNAETADMLVDMKNKDTLQGEIIGLPIKVFEPAIGMIPFEFEIEGFPEIEFSINDDILMIKGDSFGEFSSGCHIGHKITKVIK
ncbi:hypothetical protein K0B04_03015 [Patescibacteria group bacterium]|nr:hypothetical protein [Patescibacteria group bacterium]